MKRTTKPAGKPQAAAKPAGPVSQALTAAQAARKPGKGGEGRSLPPLARAIRNAYKGAKAGRQEAEILRRIEDYLPEPSAKEVGQALAASGIPAHRAGKVAADWDTMERLGRPPAGKGPLLRVLQDADPESGVTSRLRAQLAEQRARDAARARIANLPAGKWEWEDLGRMVTPSTDKAIASMFGTIYRTSEEGKGRAIILRILRGLAPTPERLEAVLSDIPERERMTLAQHYRDGARSQERGAAAAKRDEIATGLIRQALVDLGDLEAAALPQTAEECPAYLKRVFDSADPERIAADTGAALDRIQSLVSSRSDHDLLEDSGIPKAWHHRIYWARVTARSAREAEEQKAEIERRKQAQAPAAAEAPQPKAEAREPFGEALKTIVDSGYSVAVNGKTMDLRGLPLWQRTGVCIQPGEIADIRAQADVVIGLVDGVTNLLAERDPEDRETRKLSALREQVDNLIGLLDPVLTGQEGGA